MDVNNQKVQTNEHKMFIEQTNQIYGLFQDSESKIEWLVEIQNRQRKQSVLKSEQS